MHQTADPKPILAVASAEAKKLALCGSSGVRACNTLLVDTGGRETSWFFFFGTVELALGDFFHTFDCAAGRPRDSHFDLS